MVAIFAKSFLFLLSGIGASVDDPDESYYNSDMQTELLAQDALYDEPSNNAQGELHTEAGTQQMMQAMSLNESHDDESADKLRSSNDMRESSIREISPGENDRLCGHPIHCNYQNIYIRGREYTFQNLACNLCKNTVKMNDVVAFISNKITNMDTDRPNTAFDRNHMQFVGKIINIVPSYLLLFLLNFNTRDLKKLQIYCNEIKNLNNNELGSDCHPNPIDNFNGIISRLVYYLELSSQRASGSQHYNGHHHSNSTQYSRDSLAAASNMPFSEFEHLYEQGSRMFVLQVEDKYVANIINSCRNLYNPNLEEGDQYNPNPAQSKQCNPNPAQSKRYSQNRAQNNEYIQAPIHPMTKTFIHAKMIKLMSVFLDESAITNIVNFVFGMIESLADMKSPEVAYIVKNLKIVETYNKSYELSLLNAIFNERIFDKQDISDLCRDYVFKAIKLFPPACNLINKMMQLMHSYRTEDESKFLNDVVRPRFEFVVSEILENLKKHQLRPKAATMANFYYEFRTNPILSGLFSAAEGYLKNVLNRLSFREASSEIVRKLLYERESIFWYVGAHTRIGKTKSIVEQYILALKGAKLFAGKVFLTCGLLKARRFNVNNRKALYTACKNEKKMFKQRYLDPNYHTNFYSDFMAGHAYFLILEANYSPENLNEYIKEYIKYFEEYKLEQDAFDNTCFSNCGFYALHRYMLHILGDLGNEIKEACDFRLSPKPKDRSGMFLTFLKLLNLTDVSMTTWKMVFEALKICIKEQIELSAQDAGSSFASQVLDRTIRIMIRCEITPVNIYEIYFDKCKPIYRAVALNYFTQFIYQKFDRKVAKSQEGELSNEVFHDLKASLSITVSDISDSFLKTTMRERVKPDRFAAHNDKYTRWAENRKSTICAKNCKKLINEFANEFKNVDLIVGLNSLEGKCKDKVMEVLEGIIDAHISSNGIRINRSRKESEYLKILHILCPTKEVVRYNILLNGSDKFKHNP